MRATRRATNISLTDKGKALGPVLKALLQLGRALRLRPSCVRGAPRAMFTL